MKKNHITRTIIASAVLFSFNAAAATSYFEARNDAMGGTGVASSHYGVAPLANPALLTKHNSNDDFSLLLPSVGAQVADPDDVSNKADDVKDDWDLFDSAVDNRKRTARAVLTGMCYSAGSAMRHGSSSLTRLTGQSAMTPSTWRR